jgi:hypothetical protein
LGISERTLYRKIKEFNLAEWKLSSSVYYRSCSSVVGQAE